MNREEIIKALKCEDFTPYFEKADEIRKKTKGEDVFIRAIIEFSSYCTMKCKYCGLNCMNKKASRYRMEVDEILKVAYEAIDAGYRTIVLQGGEDHRATGTCGPMHPRKWEADPHTRAAG